MIMTVDILAVDAYSGMELFMPIWLNHDHGDVGEIYRWWTHILSEGMHTNISR
jgi:hypothetical protein